MSQRALLVAGIAGIAAAVVIGASGLLVGPSRSNITTISMDQAQQSVQSFLDRTRDTDLKIDELMEFQDNFYALIKEKSTGVGAFELLVNKGNGAVSAEPGPNMMWNTKYGMMPGPGLTGGRMTGRYIVNGASAAMTLGPDRATRIAQNWLDATFAGDTAGTPDAFYGYYTFHFLKNGKIDGMLSVNGYSGQVWDHTWHGAFIQARDFGA